MLKILLAATGLVLCSIGPALAIAPECGAQLSQIKAELGGQPEKDPAIAAKYQQAEQLCAANKQMEAQKLAQEIREQMAKSGTGAPAPATSGSSTQSE